MDKVQYSQMLSKSTHPMKLLTIIMETDLYFLYFCWLTREHHGWVVRTKCIRKFSIRISIQRPPTPPPHPPPFFWGGSGSSKNLLYQFFKTVQSHVFHEQMHIYKYIQLRIIFRQHVLVSLVTITGCLITRIQLIHNGIYMHHKKKHTAKLYSHIFTVKMFPIMFMCCWRVWEYGTWPNISFKELYTVMVLLEVIVFV